LSVAGPRAHWIPDELEGVWGRLWSRQVQAQRALPPAPVQIILPPPTAVLPDIAPL
jgi:hypothetical protein